MKKYFFLPLLALCLLLPAAAARAEAQDITRQCGIFFAPGSQGRDTLQDRSYLTYYTGKYLEISAPASAPCYGLYASFAGRETPFRIERWAGAGVWETVTEDHRLYANSYVALPGLEHFRIVPIGQDQISIAEITVLGEGEIPAWVQDWRPFEGKADLMVLSAHADDELLFFGGTIPYYAGERQKHVIVCYLTDQTSCRRNELLDGLWLCGIREYPSMGVFKDIKNYSLGDSYGFWGETPVVNYVTDLIRTYQPEVLVTHDIRGEYGHGAHRVCADAAIKALTYAAAQGSPAGGPWQVKKLYLHLYRENALTMDWRQPLSAFQGRTAFDMAKAAFDCHASQKSNGLIVQDWGDYANNLFGLYYSAVGMDAARNDFFENIP